MKPYIVLGVYKPKVWDARKIAEDLCGLTQRHGLVPHVDVAHGPLFLKGRNWSSVLLHAEVRRRTFKTNMAEGWHYDGDTTPGSKPDCALVLWASNNPTQIRFREYERNFPSDKEPMIFHPDNGTFQPKPYEVVIFRNLSCLHRRPPNVPRIRWVFRQRVAVPTSLELP